MFYFLFDVIIYLIDFVFVALMFLGLLQYLFVLHLDEFDPFGASIQLYRYGLHQFDTLIWDLSVICVWMDKKTFRLCRCFYVRFPHTFVPHLDGFDRFR